MPSDARFRYRSSLEMPVIGMEAEFKVFVDEEEVVPEDYWRTPAAFIDRPLLPRATKSWHLPTGGAIYFDGGVVEVATPVIEIAPQCTARVVRSLWEQIGFLREQFDAWEGRDNHRVRLQAFSTHCNISFELPREERSRTRTIQKFALLLTHLLVVPVIVTAANRRSTGIGVRPRRDRIEITLDFTPDPGLMSASIAFIVGVVREAMTWPSYLVSELDRRGIPQIQEMSPGKHVTRSGWLARPQHFRQNPFTTGIDDVVWATTDGRTLSLRQIALETATHFRKAIRRFADPFSFDLLFSILEGESSSLLDLADRPEAYDDVGRATRWGSVLPEMNNFQSLMRGEQPRRRRSDLSALAPPWRGEASDRRSRVTLPPRVKRRVSERRASAPRESDPRLTRSRYERIFLRLANGKRLTVDGEVMTPLRLKGWYHAVFRSSTGDERTLSLDQLLNIGTWSE